FGIASPQSYPLENPKGQASGQREPQFFALRQVFGGDGTMTDYWFGDFAHGIPKQDTINLAHGSGTVVASTDKQRVGKVDVIRLSRIKSTIKEVFDGPRHVTKIFWCPKEHPVTGDEILQGGLECPHQASVRLCHLTGALVRCLSQLRRVAGLGMVHD